MTTVKQNVKNATPVKDEGGNPVLSALRSDDRIGAVQPMLCQGAPIHSEVSRPPVSGAVVTALSREFADILDGHDIEPISPLKQEHDEPETLELPRLGLQFNLQNFGRLRMLLNRLNEIG